MQKRWSQIGQNVTKLAMATNANPIFVLILIPLLLLKLTRPVIQAVIVQQYVLYLVILFASVDGL